MAIKINTALTPEKLRRKLIRVFELSGQKILALERRWDPADGAPVFTARGRYRSRGWTEWTQGFQFGSMLLQFDATGEREFLALAQGHIARRMTAHLTHTGVHDHGFNIVSTFGNLLRLAREGRFDASAAEIAGYQLALKVSGAVQAMRWTPVADSGGFIYSFNGPHSLFIDTMRTLRSLALAHLLGHHLLAERDREISLLQRLAQHASTTAHYSIFYGDGRDRYDRPGRTAHESLFNINDGSFRCPATQQGYSPFTTWTRGLAWAICGFAEQLQFFSALGRADLPRAAAETLIADCSRAARATADYYLELSCADGIPVWDSGAPNLAHLPDFAERTSDPYNRCEPVDSSAAAIAAQGLWRLGSWLRRAGKPAAGRRYAAAALTIAATLFDDPYLSCGPKHEGLILHSVYHRPNGWDFIAPRQAVPNGEGSMWGDYHARELALLLLRESTSHPGPPLNFFDCALERRPGNET